MSDLDLHSRFLTVRIGIIYLVSGVGGSVLSSLFIRNTISVGASGALFGLLGAMLPELFTNWTIYSNKVQIGLGMLFRGVDANDHCGWCHYLSCVPTSRWSCGK